MKTDERILDFLDESIQKIIDNPESFGYFSAELQVLRLLEVREAVCNPDRIDEAVGSLVHRFYEFMNEEYDDGQEVRLYVRLGYNMEKWQEFLRRFAVSIRIGSIPWPPRRVEMTREESQLRAVTR